MVLTQHAALPVTHERSQTLCKHRSPMCRLRLPAITQQEPRRHPRPLHRNSAPNGSPCLDRCLFCAPREMLLTELLVAPASALMDIDHGVLPVRFQRPVGTPSACKPHILHASIMPAPASWCMSGLLDARTHSCHLLQAIVLLYVQDASANWDHIPRSR